MRLVSPAWAIRMAAHAKGIIFFDELSCAPPANQAALLRVVNERWVGETELGAGIAIIACSNPPETAAGGWDLPPAQANRFCHLNWVMDAETKDRWVKGFISWFPAPSVPRLPKDWEDGIGEYRGILAAFFQRRPSRVMEVPDSETRKGRAWPSPRTWTLGARLGAAAKAIGDESAEMTLLSGCVGTGPVLEFLAWRKELDLPDPEELLRDPSKYVHPVRGDRAFAILASVAAAYVRKQTEPRWVASWKIIAAAVKGGGADVAAIHAKTIGANRQDGFSVDAVSKNIKALLPLLKAVGMPV